MGCTTVIELNQTIVDVANKTAACFDNHSGNIWCNEAEELLGIVDDYSSFFIVSNEAGEWSRTDRDSRAQTRTIASRNRFARPPL